MREAAADELIAATDVADLLVRLGMPVPRGPRRRRGAGAHRARQRAGASELTAEELAAHSELLGGARREFRAGARAELWLESKVSEGGTSLARVREQLGARRRRVAR